MKSPEIDVVLPFQTPDQHDSLVPNGHLPSQIVAKISKKLLSESLARLVEQMGEIIADSPVETETIRMESVTISAQISAASGVQWVGAISASTTNAMSLTFRVKGGMREEPGD